MWNPFRLLFPKKFLGIDIGTSLIKITEISRFGHRRKLENYGCLYSKVLYEKAFRTFEKNTLFLSSDDISRAIRAIIKEAKIKSHQAAFSIPDFSTFFTNFELPSMSQEELKQAIRFEARQHVPLPLNEVTLDWQIIEGRPSKERKENIKILLVAVPNEVINQYREIARLAKLELVALEAEVFSLIRALTDKDEKGPISIIDIGAQSTTCNIVEKKVLKLSHSFDMSGNELTKVISKGLNIDYLAAENLKEEKGLRDEETKQILLPLVDVILKEIEKIFHNFYLKEGKEIQKIKIAGGAALIPGLKEYFAQNFKVEVEIANPFTDLFYPPILEKKLKEIGPGYAVSVGVALRGLEY